MKNTMKKSTSLLLAMLMIMSCWVFSPMEVGAATTQGTGYTVVVTVLTHKDKDFYLKNLRINTTDYKGKIERIYATSSEKNYSVTVAGAKTANLGNIHNFLSSAQDEVTLTYTFQNFPCFLAVAAQKYSSSDSSAEFSIKGVKVNNVNLPITSVTSKPLSGYITASVQLGNDFNTFDSPYGYEPKLTMEGLSNKEVNMGNAAQSVSFGNLVVKDQYGVKHADTTTVSLPSNAGGISVVADYTSQATYTPVTATIPVTAQNAGTADTREVRITLTSKSAYAASAVSQDILLNINDAVYTNNYIANPPSGKVCNLNTTTEQLNYDSPNNADDLTDRIQDYTFDGWYTVQDTDYNSPETSHLGDKLVIGAGATTGNTYYAAWSREGYSIKLNNEDGTNFKELVVYNGDTIFDTDSSFIESKQKDSNEDYHFLFKGWFDTEGNKIAEGEKIYTSKTYTATYKAVAHSVSVWTVKDEATCFAPGTLTGTCSCGKVLEKVNPEDPQLTHNYEIEVITAPQIDEEGTGKYKCTHCGGYETGEIVTIPALREVTFIYDSNRDIEYSYITSDGSALKAEDYEDVSTKSSIYVRDDYTEDGKIYNFVGWQAEADQGTDTYYTVEDFETLAITASGTYTPYYEAVYEQYDVTYTYTTADGTKTGTTQGDMSKDVYDVLADYANDYQTTDKVYTFEGWYQGETAVAEGTTVTGAMVLTAKYTPAPRQYTVTLGGEEFKVNYGEQLKKADVTVADPTKANDELGHYAFEKWTVGGEDTTSVYDMTITEDITVDAYYDFTAHDSDKEEVITAAGHGIDGVMGHYCSVCGKEMSTSVINAYYFVTFIGEDGELAKVQVTKGDVIDSTKVPVATKAEDDYNTYSFAQWTGGDVDAVVTGDVTLTATFDSTAKVYTVTYDEDGTITTVDGGYNAKVTVAEPADAEKVINHIRYTFAGWKDTATDAVYQANDEYTITANSTLEATWDTVAVDYTITLVSGETTTTETGIHGQEITLAAPEAPVGKTFVGWKAADGTMYTDKFVVDVDATLTAVFETSKHTVEFVVDGVTVDTVADVKYGTKVNTILPETDPTKAETVQYTYEFKYWTVDGAEVTDETTVAANTTVVAEFETITKSVKVTYVDRDGTERTSTVKYGETFDPAAFVGEAESNKEIHYKFTGWANLDGSAVTTEGLTSPIKVYAQYDEIPHVYTTKTIAPTCTEEGKTIYTCSGCGFSYEEPIAALGHDLFATRVEPVKDQPGSISKKCSRCEYEEDAIKLWNVVYKVDDVTKDTVVAQEGETIYFGSSPRVSDKVENNVNYTLSHWKAQDGAKFDKTTANVSYKVTGYTEFKAVWEKSNAYATVTFEYGDKGVSTKKYEIGATPIEPDDVSKMTDDEFEYTFLGWDNEITEVTGDVKYVAQYKKEAKTITVIFKADGMFFSADTEKTVKAGTAVVAPTLSAEDSFVLEGTKHYTFTGWNVSDTLLGAVKCDGTTLEVTATIKTYLDHDYSKFMGVVQEATCCNPEISKYRCEYCNAVVEVESAPATGKHNFVYECDRVVDGKTFKVYGCTTCDLENLEEVIIDQHQDIEMGFGFDTHTPATGLNVTVYDEENKQVALLVTNAQGKVQLSLDPGTYTAVIEGKDLEKSTTVKFVVRADGTWDYVGDAPVIVKRPTVCTCKCHDDTFWARIFRFFHKIIKLFAGKYVCCDCGDYSKYN